MSDMFDRNDDTQLASGKKPRLEVSLGEMLVAARLKKGLGERELAEFLKITLSKLKALESNDFKSFPAQLYVRGYLKNYARAVDLSQDDVLSYYREYYEEDSEASYRGEQNFVAEDQAAPYKEYAETKRPWWLLYVVIVLVLIGVLLSTSGLLDKAPVAGSVEDSESNALFDEGSESLDDNDFIADSLVDIDDNRPESDATAIASIRESIEPEISEAASSGQLNAEVASESPVEINENLVTEMLASKLTASELIKIAPFEGVQLGSSEGSVRIDQALLPSGDILTFNFDSECWVEVTDSSGTLLFSGLKMASSELILSGSAPFNIVVGNVVGTRLSFNDDTVELDSPINGRPVRMQIGG